MMYSLLCYSLLLGLSFAVIESYDDTQVLCAYSISPLHVRQHNHSSGNYVDANNTQHCSKSTDACFIFWKEDQKNKSIIIYTQGCWDGKDKNCRKDECIAFKKPTEKRNTLFCCCVGNYCNSNITEGFLTDSTESPEDPLSTFSLARETVVNLSYSIQVVIAFVAVVALIVLLTITYFFTHLIWPDPKQSTESLNLIEAPPPPPPSFDLDSLKISKESIGQGGFGSVYCGNLNDRTVAVKIFPYNYRNYFFNEREIYTLPHMKHPSIPEYIGYQERLGKDERIEYMLVLSYSPQGCLQNYLKERTLDWSQLCKMSLSIACGMSHLHTEIMKDEKHRHCIAHRDLSSRNILMKADGTCMLCDFGFALQVTGSKYFLNGAEGQAEADSLTEVGTLRYKAPELLEGSVNLRDLESSLKNIDIYALGLILWEIATRCSDLYQGQEVPSYKLPYEAEVGERATPEQIKTIVVMHKARPQFPETWKSRNPAIKSLKETIEDCWDHDAEARLTALCVEERLSELLDLMKRFKADYGNGPTSPSNLQKSFSFEKNEISSDIYDSSQYICPRDRANSLSDCTTDTLLSPSIEIVNNKNLINSNSTTPINIKHFQGCNTQLNQDQVQQHSNHFPTVDNSINYSKKNGGKKFISFSDGDTILSVPGVVAENQTLSNSKPFPFLSNAKKPTSLLGNHVPKDFLNKIASLIVSLNRKTTSNTHLPEEQKLLRGSSISSPVSPGDLDGKHSQINPIDSEWCDVKLNNDFSIDTITKPNSEIPNNHVVAINMLDNGEIPIENVDAMCDTTEVKLESNEVAKSEKTKRPSTLPVHFLENELNLDENLLEESDVDISKEIVIDDDQQKKVVVRRGSRRKSSIKRVQTPYEMSTASARLSLYDDRIMSSQQLSYNSKENSTHSEFDNVKPSASVPNMNTLCSAKMKLDYAPYPSDSGFHSSSGSTEAHSQEQQLNKKEETAFREVLKKKPGSGLLVPVNLNGDHDILIV